ncbi:MAG: ABC transporter substrate-binding protein [Spirochaetales bacterium]|nr:ABC transporter substrate-binding protein [Spirochaetales bacterium]
MIIKNKMTIARRAGAILFAAILMLAFGCGGQARVFKVGILNGHDVLKPIGDGFKAKMTELGYVEGTNIVYDYQTSGFAVDMDLYRKLSQQFADDKVDVVVSYPTEASLVAKEVLAGAIPLVFCNASTEDTGLINSIQNPGTNITGARYPTPEIALRRLEVLQQIKPSMKKVLAPYLKGYPTIPSQIKALDAALKNTGLQLVEMPVSSPPEMAAGLEKMKGRGIDGVLFFSEPASITPDFAAPVFAFAGRNKIPISVVESAYDGVEFTVGVMVDFNELGKEVAVITDKILKGAPAGDIPVATSNNYLTVNYKEAQRLGLTVPEGVLKQAVKVVR